MDQETQRSEYAEALRAFDAETARDARETAQAQQASAARRRGATEPAPLVEILGRLRLPPGVTLAEVAHALALIGATFTLAPQRGTRAKAPVTRLHRAPTWPPRGDAA